ncbi:hypothetical protein GCM10008905_29170 [Clostridium malenominatum]|uniref:Uncharacterized protein n=1 Tax=Clostridium malenominatum TaxID=1539 RepID=A0ABN1J5E3_9CLOT
MEAILWIISLFLLYTVINEAINRSMSTALLKENLRVLIEIRELLKDRKKGE